MFRLSGILGVQDRPDGDVWSLIMEVDIIMSSGVSVSGKVEYKDMESLFKSLSVGGYIVIKDVNGEKFVNKRNILYVRRKR